MDGGSGADTFRFATANTGSDRIEGFETAFDRFDLAAEALGAARIGGQYHQRRGCARCRQRQGERLGDAGQADGPTGLASFAGRVKAAVRNHSGLRNRRVIRSLSPMAS